MFLNYIIFMLFVHLLINYVIFTLEMLNINLTKHPNNHYVKLTLGY